MGKDVDKDIVAAAATTAAVEIGEQSENHRDHHHDDKDNNNNLIKIVIIDDRQSKSDAHPQNGKKKKIEFAEIEIDEPYKLEIVWWNVFRIVVLHLGAILAVPLIPSAHDATIAFTYVLILATMLGVQAGAHRLWSHRAFRAKRALRIFLSICFLVAMQNDLLEWCRDHRVHHKFTETDADPHDARRGFFFSHMGWLMCRKHPAIRRRGATIDLGDLLADPVVCFQRRHYTLLVAIFWALLPTAIPVAAWQESLLVSFVICVLLRYTITLHVTWLVNSWAHMYGRRPYDTTIAPVEASIRHAMAGEGFHNYHHSFPCDYRASEFGPATAFNPVTLAINFFAACGWAYELKSAESSLIERKIASVGDRKTSNFRNCGKSSSTTRIVFRFLREWIIGLCTITFPLYMSFAFKYGTQAFCNANTSEMDLSNVHSVCTFAVRREPILQLFNYIVII